MDIEFRNPDLERLVPNDAGQGGYGLPIIKAFRKVVRFIKSAGDERDFRAMRSLNFEKLKGNRSHQHSFRLNDQWRLIVEIKEGTPKNKIEVVDIEDYH
jgi:proteic killer suppression protein